MIEEDKVETNESVKTSRRWQASSTAKLGFTVAGLGIGGMLAYLISRNTRAARGPARQIESPARNSTDNVVDDQGTTQEEAAQILRNLKERGFDSSDENSPLRSVERWRRSGVQFRS
jgi:hypothetical protein